MPRSIPWDQSSKQPKRAYETIDLTGSDEEGRGHNKTPRVDKHKPHSPPLPTPSSSSASTTRTPSRNQWRRPSPPPQSSSQTPSSSANASRTLARTPSLTQQSVPSPSRNQWHGHSSSSSLNYPRPDATHSRAERDSWLQPSQSQSHAGEGDIYENIASSQNVVIGSEDFVKYGELPTKIVGVRYYQGFATFGEHIEIIREPSNPYDPNGRSC